MEKESSRPKWRSPILYEPWWAFMQPEWWKWVEERRPIGYSRIDFLIKLHTRLDKEYAKRLQRRQQQVMDLPANTLCRGTGKPYRGPNWSDECDNTEHQPELSIDPRLWDIPRKFNPTVKYDRRWTHPPKRQERTLRPVYEYHPQEHAHGESKIDEYDYIPFFFHWQRLPRLSVDERALLETEEDGMIITQEIARGEWS